MTKKQPRRSLRTKIIAWSFVPTVIILSAVAWLTFYSYQRVIGDLAIKEDQILVASQAGHVARAIGDLVNRPLVPIVLEIDLNHGDPIETRAQKILQEAENLDIFDGGVYFLDQKGKVVVAWPERSDLLGQDWSYSPHFRYIKENPGKAAFTDIQPIGPQGKDIVCSALSMLNLKKEFAGAGYYCFLIHPDAANPYYTTLTILDLGPNVYLLDRNQRVIFSSDPSQMSKDISDESYIRQLFNGQKMAARVKKGTEDLVASYAPVFSVSEEYNIQWTLLKEQRWAEIMRPSLAYRQLLLILLALGVIVPVIVTAIGVRHITNPIEKLIQASEQVTAGQLEQRIDVNTDDEIEALAEQFNLMSARLYESYSSLENKVAERTRELAIMNSIVSVASRSLNIQEILDDALSKTIEQMGFDAAAAFRLESDPTTTQLIINRGIERTTAVDLVNIYATTSRVNTVDNQQKVTTFVSKDFPDGKLKSQLEQFGLQSLVFVPLSSKGRNLGLFILGKYEQSPFSPEELSLLGAIGQQVGVAMENARLYEQAEHVAIAAERNRLARELHDAVTQTLFSANLIADVLPRIWKRNPEEGFQNLEELRQLTRGALAEMRTMLLEMRPESLERSDIKSLLTQLVDAFIGRVRVPVFLAINGDCELTHEVKIVFYRIAQEALNNIAKHSGARQVDMRMECKSGKVNLVIKDDGLGFDPASIPPGHMGIAIMRERASSIGAHLNIESQIGQGTIVELDWKSDRRD